MIQQSSGDRPGRWSPGKRSVCTHEDAAAGMLAHAWADMSRTASRSQTFPKSPKGSEAGTLDQPTHVLGYMQTEEPPLPAQRIADAYYPRASRADAGQFSLSSPVHRLPRLASTARRRRQHYHLLRPPYTGTLQLRALCCAAALTNRRVDSPDEPG